MSAKLVAEEGLLKELVLSFDGGDQWVIGRDPDACQLLVEDPAASRQHVLCRRIPEGILLENLSKTNPVQINDEAILEPYLLQSGDVVKIGDTVFKFYPDEGVQLAGEEPSLITENLLPESEEREISHDTILEEINTKENLPHVHFDLLETGRWLLKVVGGPNSGAEFSMQAGGTYLIGTDPNACDIVFYDTSVSRQHGRISITEDDQLFIEDLKSRNGTRIDGELIHEKHLLPLNTLIALGTSSFVIYDREGEMQTVISPLLPSIVKVLQKEESQKEEGATAEPKAEVSIQPASPEEVKEAEALETPSEEPHKGRAFGGFIVTAILIGIFAVAGMGIKALFTQNEVVIQAPVNEDQLLANALKAFPDVKYSFNKATGRLLLVGHVLSVTDRNQLLYNLQGLPFIHDIDDVGVVIDEYVWTEINQVLARNPDWRGVTVHASSPGHFIISGYLQTRAEGEDLMSYLSLNFPYQDILENKVVIDEDVSNSINAILRNNGFTRVTPQVSIGELTLTGAVPKDKMDLLNQLVESFKQTSGVRSVRNYVTETTEHTGAINITSKYKVSGTSRSGNAISVILNGRIIQVGDILDGMRVTSIDNNRVLLQKEGETYRIDIT